MVLLSQAQGWIEGVVCKYIYDKNAISCDEAEDRQGWKFSPFSVEDEIQIKPKGNQDGVGSEFKQTECHASRMVGEKILMIGTEEVGRIDGEDRAK